MARLARLARLAILGLLALLFLLSLVFLLFLPSHRAARPHLAQMPQPVPLRGSAGSCAAPEVVHHPRHQAFVTACRHNHVLHPTLAHAAANAFVWNKHRRPIEPGQRILRQ